MSSRTISARVLLVALFGVAAPAWASSEYPSVIQAELSMDCPPPCTICHKDNQGGLFTVFVDEGGKPFGEALMELGDLASEEPEQLRRALAVLDTQNTDSDGDGVSDIDALRANRNPNIGGSVCGPLYGCGASIALPSGKKNGATSNGAGQPRVPRFFELSGALFVSAALLVLRRRRRAK